MKQVYRSSVMMGLHVPPLHPPHHSTLPTSSHSPSIRILYNVCPRGHPPPLLQPAPLGKGEVGLQAMKMRSWTPLL